MNYSDAFNVFWNFSLHFPAMTPVAVDQSDYVAVDRPYDMVVDWPIDVKVDRPDDMVVNRPMTWHHLIMPLGRL